MNTAMWHFVVKQEYNDGTLSKYDQEPKPQPRQCSLNVFAKYMFNENYSKEHTVI